MVEQENPRKYNGWVAFIIMLMLALAATVGVSPGTASAEEQYDWHWQNPLPQGNYLFSVSVHDANNAWAVGDSGSIIHWNGTAWAVQDSGTGVNLKGVFTLDEANVWAVGESGTILYWNGSFWAEQDSTTGVTLKGVTAWSNGDNTEAWAVGESGVIVHWNGTAWAAQESHYAINLNGVSAINSNNVWAAGDSGLVLQWNGLDWIVNAPGHGLYLYGVSASAADNVWAVGQAGVTSHWNGSGWTTEYTGTGIDLNGVSTLGANEVWEAGDQGTVRHWNGSSWSTPDSGTTRDLFGVAMGTSDSVWIMGGWGVILHWNGSGLSRQDSGGGPTLNGVSAASETCAWAVGEGGVILHWDGSSWSAQDSHTSENLKGVFALTSTSAWVVGNGGTILHWSGSNWSAQESNTSEDLGGVCAIDDAGTVKAWAVGGNGTIVYWDGSSWSVQSSNTTAWLRSVSAVSANCAWTVGGQGVVRYWNGSSWAEQYSTTSATMTGVTTWSDGDATEAWAVGYSGEVIHWNGSAWEHINHDPDWGVLTGVSEIDPQDIWVSGWKGILHGDGTTFEFQTPPRISPDTWFLYGVSALDVNNVWVAGGNGSILHGSTSVTCLISSCSPQDVVRGTTRTVEITGEGTHFEQGVSEATFSGDGITVTSTDVTSETQATAHISIDAGATQGYRNVNVETDTEVPNPLTGVFRVTDPPPTVVGITPDEGTRGTSVAVTDLSGTDFQAVGTTVVSLKKGAATINATGVVVESPQKITCAFDLTGAEEGTWDVSVTNPDEQSGALAGGFEVKKEAIISVSPAIVRRGETRTIQIEGKGTHFGPSSNATISGGGINVNSTTVADATHATAEVTVEPGVSLGARDVNVETGTENPNAAVASLIVNEQTSGLARNTLDEATLTETLKRETVNANGIAVTGDHDGTTNLAFELVRVDTGSFKGMGFFEGTFETTLDDVFYEGQWRGTANFDSGSNAIRLKGILSGDLVGIADANITETTPGSGLFDRYSAGWKLNRILGDNVYSALQQDGTLMWPSADSYPGTNLAALQGSYTGQGDMTDGSSFDLGTVLTHLLVDDAGNPYDGEGFSMLSYNCPSGSGEAWMRDDPGAPGEIEVSGFSTEPYSGTARGTVTDASMTLSFERIDSGRPPEPELDVQIISPSRIIPGQAVSYTVVCRNDGLSQADDVQVVLNLPRDVQDYQRSTDDGVQAEGLFHEVVWDVGDIAPKSSKETTAVFKVKNGLQGQTVMGPSAYILKDPVDLQSKGRVVSVTREQAGALGAAPRGGSGESDQTAFDTKLLIKGVTYDVQDLLQRYVPKPAQITFNYFKKEGDIWTSDASLVDKYMQSYKNNFESRRDVAAALISDPLFETYYGTVSMVRNQDFYVNAYLNHHMDTADYNYLTGTNLGLGCTKLIMTVAGLKGLSAVPSNSAATLTRDFIKGLKEDTVNQFLVGETERILGGDYRQLYREACEGNSEKWKTTSNQTVTPAHDPNIKYGPQGNVQPGQTLPYKVEFENEGEGTAYDVYFTDTLAEGLDDSTLDIGAVYDVATGVQIAPAGTYDAGTRTITWIVGEVAPHQGGYAELRVNVRTDAPKGTQIVNSGTVYFPSACEVTPTNAIVSIIPYSPSIDPIEPGSGTAAGEVRITGQHFDAERGESYVEFGGNRCADSDYVSWSDGELWVKVPAGVLTGTVNVFVTTAGGKSGAQAFTVLHAPVLSSVAPANGTAGTVVTVSGSYFGSDRDSSCVKFGDTICADSDCVSWSDGQVKVKVPAGAAIGAQGVTVTTALGTSNAGTFTVNSPPSPTWYLAEGSTLWLENCSCYISVENPNATAVTAKLTYMTPTGAVDGPQLSMPPLSQATVNPAETLGRADFSTKVECLEGKTITADRTMIWNAGAGEEGHCAVGVPAASTTWYLPEGSSNWGFESWLLIQNPDAAPANCTLTYMTDSGEAIPVSHQVPPNSRASFSMEGDIGQKDASIKVESDVPVIPERAMYRNGRREGHDSTGTTTPATDYYLAEGTTGWGFTTFVLIQNPQSTPTDVKVTYMTGAGTHEESFQMPPDSRRTINVNAVHPDLPTPDFSTLVHGSQAIIAERAMYWDSGAGEACHDSIGMESAHACFYLPDGQTSDGRETWTLVQNPNATDVTVDVSYLTPLGEGNVTKTEVITANSRRTFNMVAHSGLQGRSAIMVTSKTPGMKVMVERAMYWNERGAGTDTIGGFSD